MFFGWNGSRFFVFQWFRFRIARTIAVGTAQSFKIQTIQIPNFKKFRFKMYSSHYCNSSQWALDTHHFFCILELLFGLNSEVQRGSKFRASLVLKRQKYVQSLNGVIFRWHLITRNLGSVFKWSSVLRPTSKHRGRVLSKSWNPYWKCTNKV